MTDVTLCAMIIFVTSFRAASASRIFFSVAVSTALVESSKIRIFAFPISARAMQRRCFWPPERLLAPCSSTVSRPSGMRFKNSSAHAARHASQISSSDASTLPHFRFSRTVPENSTFFCRMILTASRRAARSYARTSFPPTRTVPRLVSYRRGMSCTSVVFEEPVPPRIPTV